METNEVFYAEGMVEGGSYGQSEIYWYIQMDLKNGLEIVIKLNLN
jgi:hypothetical protein